MSIISHCLRFLCLDAHAPIREPCFLRLSRARDGLWFLSHEEDAFSCRLRMRPLFIPRGLKQERRSSAKTKQSGHQKSSLTALGKLRVLKLKYQSTCTVKIPRQSFHHNILPRTFQDKYVNFEVEGFLRTLHVYKYFQVACEHVMLASLSEQKKLKT